MKNILKAFGLISLILFSFFYTDKVIEVIREEDEIMIELESVKDTYKVAAINASVTADTIIPGLDGRKIDIEKSYKSMKENGVFNKEQIVYDTIKPSISVTSNKDKFIIMGNNNKQMVSLLFPLSSNRNLDNLEAVLKEKEVTANYFVSYKYLINNTTKIKKMEDREFYSYGEEGEYTPDNLLFSANLISRITNNNATYCLTKEMDKDTLKLCSNNELYTIVPSIIGGKNSYNEVVENLASGSIILLEINSETISKLPTIIDYIKGKGLKIGTLSNLLSEELTS